MTCGLSTIDESPVHYVFNNNNNTVCTTKGMLKIFFAFIHIRNVVIPIMLRGRLISTNYRTWTETEE